MLMILLISIMTHYGILVDQVVAEYINKFLMGFIGINTAGKLTTKIAEAIASRTLATSVEINKSNIPQWEV